MKIKDVEPLNEGPLDFAKKVAGAIASPIKTASQAMDRSAGNAQLDSITKKLMASWQQQVAAQNAAGQPMNDVAVYQQKMLKWFSTAAFKKDLGVITQAMGPLTGVGAGPVNNYLRKAVGLHMAGEFEGGSGAPAGGDPAGNVGTPGGGNIGTPGGETTGNTAGNTASNTAPAVSTVDPSAKLFKDPALFKAEWDKYTAAQTQPYQLISDPRMVEVLKDMWMRTGGTSVAGNQLPKTTNDKFGNPVAPAAAPAKPTLQQKYFNESKQQLTEADWSKIRKAVLSGAVSLAALGLGGMSTTAFAQMSPEEFRQALVKQGVNPGEIKQVVAKVSDPVLPTKLAEPAADTRIKKLDKDPVVTGKWKTSVVRGAEIDGPQRQLYSIDSNNVVDLGFPYGKTKLTLYIRMVNGKLDPNGGVFVTSSGQFHSGDRPDNADGTLKYKIDSTPVKQVGYQSPKDASTGYGFINNPETILKEIVNGKTMKMQISYFQKGDEIFDFDIAGLENVIKVKK
jgi:hypothetical protein